ncbi:adhesion G protein-coupled receptor E3-like [Ostrea edulis]|uniref:adhesion G protein-coupled receptor E3-like n=1 Tax=Ostrea edulis TaxID=37623 RepID=UPI0024AFC49A|nr:adhesion G protein-coupled receptor E3-like [Ostrea edulis]
MCHNGGIESYCYEELEANGGLTDIPGPTLPPSPYVGTFRSTFTFSAYDTYDTGIDKSNIKCQQYQIFDDYQNTCKNFTCFPGKLLRNDTCVSLLMEASNLRYTWALKLEFINLALINTTVKESITKIRNFISQNIHILFNTYVFVEDFISMSRIGCSDVFSKNGEVLLYLKMFINDTVNRDEMEHKLLSFTDSRVDWNLSDMLAQDWNGSIMNVRVSRSPQSLFLPSFLWKLDKKTHCFVQAENLSHGPAVYRNVLVNPMLTCKQVIVKDGDFGVAWTKIGTKYSFLGFSLSSHQFVSSDSGGVRVCAEEIPFYTKTTTVSKNDLSPILIVTLVCIIISLICLIITFVTYCMFSSLRTLPGMNNMCLVVSLFLAQLLMIIRPSFRSTWLSIVSALLHFSWLSTFLWLQVCSFHVFRVFSAKGQSDFLGRQSRKIVIKYSIYAYGSSAVIVLTNIVITLIVTNGENTGYDKTSALMTYSVAFIATLIVPLALVCMTNIVFYIFTAYKIYSTPKIEKTTGSRVHFSVYVKLFTLTGLSWILQIIDTFLEMSILSYLVAILNGLQGLFLMISYVCNGRVWRMYMKACCKTPSDRDISKASTKTDVTKI